jgi:hypothetical protein
MLCLVLKEPIEIVRNEEGGSRANEITAFPSDEGHACPLTVIQRAEKRSTETQRPVESHLRVVVASAMMKETRYYLD